MRCDEVPLEALLPSADDGAGVEEASRHLIDCPDCRERLWVMVRLSALSRRRKSEPRFARAKPWLAAAAVLLALTLPALLPPPTPSPAPEAPALGTPYPRFPLATRSRPRAPDARDRAFDAYRRGDFEEASKLLRGLPADTEVDFFLGVALLQTGRPEEALRALDKSASEEGRWLRPSLWYRAAALLALDRRKEAWATLRRLAQTDGEFRRQAEEALADPAFANVAPEEKR